ncbi:MAG: RelA/SpoT domain-containing protein, partial [Chthoniobacterales bacterium]
MQSWTEPRHTSREVTAAGKLLYHSEVSKNSESYLKATEVVENWRDAHNYPLHVIKKRLKAYAKKVDSASAVGQRIKRLRSIEAKMKKESGMRLAQMQDIGGCRAVLDDTHKVLELVRLYKERTEHKFAREKDYFAEPRNTGYRSYHLIYRFNVES